MSLGGYEVERSLSNFDQKNKLQKGVEDKIKKIINLSLKQIDIIWPLIQKLKSISKKQLNVGIFGMVQISSKYILTIKKNNSYFNILAFYD